MIEIMANSMVETMKRIKKHIFSYTFIFNYKLLYYITDYKINCKKKTPRTSNS
jgi:hypothetical protein